MENIYQTIRGRTKSPRTLESNSNDPLSAAKPWEFMLEDDQGAHARFAYRVSKDYGNVFYKDYLKMVLGDDFTDVMGYADAAAEKCGDVVEMWLGMLDLSAAKPFLSDDGVLSSTLPSEDLLHAISENSDHPKV